MSLSVLTPWKVDRFGAYRTYLGRPNRVYAALRMTGEEQKISKERMDNWLRKNGMYLL